MDYENEHLKHKTKYLELKSSDNQLGGGNSKFARFAEWLDEKFNSCWYLPGLSIAIFNDENILFKKSYGYANVKTKRKLKLTDKFCIASCSKSILCLAITLAINKKDIPDIWNMDLGDVFKNINIYKDFAKCPIVYLANHTSGISDFPLNCSHNKKKIFTKYEDMEGTKSRKLISQLILKNKPTYKPNSEWKYSNIGYGILGHIIEKLTGTDYSQFIDKYIFEPLNIEAKYKKYYTGEGIAEGHYINFNFRNAKYIPLGKNQHINPTYEEPAGEIYINSLDFAKYAQQYLFNNSSKLIDKSIYKTMTKKNKNNYALGLLNADKFIGHGGSYFNTTSEFRVYPKKNIGFVVSSNCEYLSWIMQDLEKEIEKYMIHM